MEKKRVLFEGIFIVIISFIGVYDGIRLILCKDPQGLYDCLGPGSYILILSLGLTITGVAHLLINYRKASSKGVKSTTQKTKNRSMIVIYMVSIFSIYVFLINIFGYFLSTILFLLLEFKIAGVKSWKVNIILTLSISIGFYIVFIKYCGMVFPRGIFEMILNL